MMRVAPTAGRVAACVRTRCTGVAHARAMSTVGGPDAGNKYSDPKRIPVNPITAFARRTLRRWRARWLAVVLSCVARGWRLWRCVTAHASDRCARLCAVMDRISSTFLLEDITRGTWIALEGTRAWRATVVLGAWGT